MKASHVAVLGMALAAVAGMGANLQNWHQALQPSFVFPALAALGSTLAGIQLKPMGKSGDQ